MVGQNVSFGSNTTRTYDKGAPPATPSFGATPGQVQPAAGAFSFGGFGSPAPAAPAPAAGNLFGTPTAAAPVGGGLFGAAAPAPAGAGMFGATVPPVFGSPAPAAAGGMFGAAATPAAGGLFGSAPPTTGVGITPQQHQQQQQQQIPAHAAMQAHMDASARQEQARVMAEMEHLHSAYSGAPPKEDSKDKTAFVSMVYNDVTPEQLTLQWSMGGANASIVPPPKPPSVSHKEWTDAVAKNPDPQRYMPVALVGADSLRARVGWQQERAIELQKGVAQLVEAHGTILKNSQRFKLDVQGLTRTHAALRKQLLNVMRKVEVARCMNLPLQQDELVVKQRLAGLMKQVDQVASVMANIQDQVRNQPRLGVASNLDQTAALPNQQQLLQVMTEQRGGIAALAETLQRDMRDVHLLQQQVNNVPNLSASSMTRG